MHMSFLYLPNWINTSSEEVKEAISEACDCVETDIEAVR